MERTCDKVQRGGIKIHLEREIIENNEAKLILTVFEKYDY